MKTRVILILSFFLFISQSSKAQFAFGVSPGLNLNGAYFGYQINNKVVPYAGLQFFNLGFKFEENGERYDFSSNSIISYSDTETLNGSLLIPTIGTKYFFLENNKLKSFFNLGISKPILWAKNEYNGQENEELKEAVDNLNLWGGEFGFGVEYYFSENFSLGGEFGLRFLHARFQETQQTTIFDPNAGNFQQSEISRDYRFNFSPTFSRITLNYYFSRKTPSSEVSTE